MPTADYELAQTIRTEKRLHSLHRKLTFGSASAGFLWVLFWLPFGPVLLFLLACAVAFMPYIVFSLFQLRKTGWLLTITILVLVPIAASIVFGAPHLLSLLPGVEPTAIPAGVGGYLLWVAPLVGFYVCTFLLRHSVGLWLEEATWTRKDLEEIRKSAARREVDAEPGP